jgi:hypothetical protein
MGMARIWNLITMKKFNDGFARTITLVDWCGFSKDIKFICNTFIWYLIVEFYRAIEKKSSLVATTQLKVLQHCFQQSLIYRV